MSFVQKKSKGFTNKGALLLQEAVESYVYSVLGAQARTRFKIVGAGAKSSQTQRIFHTIVKDTVAQDDDSVLIGNMRTAINQPTLLWTWQSFLVLPFTEQTYHFEQTCCRI